MNKIPKTATIDQGARCSYPAGLILLPLFVYGVSVALSWRGFGNWDAIYYINTAMDWKENGPVLGTAHWDLRYPLVLPIAGSLTLFGSSEISATIPNLIYGALLVFVSATFGARYLGARSGLFLGLLVATSAPLTLLPLEIEIRGPETFFSVFAIWLFIAGATQEKRSRLLVVAGVTAGVAWLCREVAGYLPLSFILVTLLFVAKERRSAAAIHSSVGFLTVIVFELVLYAVIAGDPLYRYRIDLGHGGGNPDSAIAAGISLSRLVDLIAEPFVLRLAEQSTIILIAGGAAAGLAILLLRRELDQTVRFTLSTFFAAAFVSFLYAAVLLNLEAPRYFPLLDYLALVLIASAAGILEGKGINYIALPLVAGCAAVGPLVTDLRRGYDFESIRLAARVAKEEPDVLVTTKWVADRAEVVLRLEGWSSQEAEAEFALRSNSKPDSLAIVQLCEYCRMTQPSDFSEFEWEKVGEAGTLRPSWSHRLLSSVATHIPLPDILSRKTEPKTVILLRRKADNT